MGPAGLTPADIQSQVMGFADTYQAMMSEAWDRTRHDEVNVLTANQRTAAIGLKVQMISGAYSIAITANPVVALMDMIVLVELQREAIADHWIPEEFGEAGEPVRVALDGLQADIWRLADDVFTERQQEDLRNLIAAWREEHPDQVYVSYVRIADFAQRSQSLVASQSSSSILSLVQLDPLAGLDPAAREILQTRLLAERSFYYLERLPYLLQWRVDYQIFRVLALDDVAQLLEQSARITGVTERLVTAVEELPEDVGAERQALVEQVAAAVGAERQALVEQVAETVGAERTELVNHVLEGVAAERQALVDILEQDTANLGPLLANLRATLEAGTVLATAVKADLDAIQTLSASSGPPDPDAPPSEPLDFEEIRAATESATQTVNEANELIDSLATLLESPAWETRTAEFDRVSTELLDTAFWRLLILLIVLLVGGLATVLIYKRVAG